MTGGPPTPAAPVETTRRIDAGGRVRSYTTLIPATVGPSTPLVVVFHGSNQSAAGFRAATGGSFDRLAGAGCVVVYPDGYRGSWNDARRAISFPARVEGCDDVAFTGAVIDRVATELGLASRQAHLIGFSNGGQMVIRILHEAPERVGAAAIIAATQPAQDNFAFPAAPAAPRPVMLVHGTRDRVVPYGGGVAGRWDRRPRGRGLSAAATAAYYAARNGITAPPTERPLPRRRGRGTRVTRAEYHQAGRHPVVLYTVPGGGHTVPGPGVPGRIGGRTNRDLDTAAAAAAFFGVATP